MEHHVELQSPVFTKNKFHHDLVPQRLRGFSGEGEPLWPNEMAKWAKFTQLNKAMAGHELTAVYKYTWDWNAKARELFEPKDVSGKRTNKPKLAMHKCRREIRRRLQLIRTAFYLEKQGQTLFMLQRKLIYLKRDLEAWWPLPTGHQTQCTRTPMLFLGSHMPSRDNFCAWKTFHL